MKFWIEKTEDVDTVREAHSLAFPGDQWVGDEQEYWLAYDSEKKVVGFCSAVYGWRSKSVVLSRAAVLTRANGWGLQDAMIRTRIAWAHEEVGANFVVTYTSLYNYASMYNLMRNKFRALPARVNTGSTQTKDWHVFWLRIDGKKRPPSPKLWEKVAPLFGS